MAKGIMYVDGQRVPFDGEPNVLAVIRKAGIEMPTFCYYSDLSVYGACRMCVVEDERGKIDASCSMQPRDGLSIKTNTARLLKHRRMILELMLASHNCNCTICEKSGDCHLQELALQFGVRHIRFQDNRDVAPIDATLCKGCGKCKRQCPMEAIDGQIRMPHTIDTEKCIKCGACVSGCPFGAIVEV